MAIKSNKSIYRGANPSALRQGGYATLGIGLVLLFMLSLMTIYLSKSGILDLRASANKARHAEALAQAELRLDKAYAWLSGKTSNVYNYKSLTTSSWQLCNHSSITANLPPAVEDDDAWEAAFDRDGDGTVEWACACLAEGGGQTACSTTTTYIATPVADRGSIYFLFASGQSTDNTANAIVKQGLYFYNPLFPGNPSGPPPLMATGNIPLNGNINVVGNPNGGGPGVNVAIWSDSDIDDPQSNAAATCQQEEYVRNGECDPTAISYKDHKGADIVDAETSPTTVFPPDMFQYMFGVPSSNYGVIKQAATVVSDCSGLGPTSTGFYWVTGDCMIPANNTYGSQTNPLLIVVENSNFTANANSTFYGVTFAFCPTGNSSTCGVKLNGGATIHGAVLSSINIDLPNGTFDMVYSVPVVSKILDPEDGFVKVLARMPGSWADYL